jgi:hypothetical protein
MRDDGRVTLYHVSTGESLRRWPVDAREILAHPATEYALELPAPAVTISAAPETDVAALADAVDRHLARKVSTARRTAGAAGA